MRRPFPRTPEAQKLTQRVSVRGLDINDRLVRSREERRCSIPGPTQSRISPSIL